MPEPDTSRAKVVLVDYQPNNLDLLNRILEPEGCNIWSRSMVDRHSS